MPGPSDLIGQTFGELTVIGRGRRRSHERYWRVRCRCGRVETYPQRRLTQKRRDAVRVCAACRARACSVCGAELPPSTRVAIPVALHGSARHLADIIIASARIRWAKLLNDFNGRLALLFA
jgi:hypothetical protein